MCSICERVRIWFYTVSTEHIWVGKTTEDCLVRSWEEAVVISYDFWHLHWATYGHELPVFRTLTVLEMETSRTRRIILSRDFRYQSIAHWKVVYYWKTSMAWKRYKNNYQCRSPSKFNVNHFFRIVSFSCFHLSSSYPCLVSFFLHWKSELSYTFILQIFGFEHGAAECKSTWEL